MENNAAVRSVWPFKPRVSDHQNGEDNHLGDACSDFLCVGADHRSIDGGRAGRLLNRTAGRPQETVIPTA
jgi:hypothetical protein